ncbi:uncharacterized protein FIESC28_03233 [Fusarium coffeatum]|uniref:Uncharacterized protein n=3 Tax=Fusarium incarnatum-equiseti species complex TaxID=450425 RepID=A0A9W8PX00_9HYPO|nr:uncharacterized protein FIESC28_03233 [Fusarium coffeatum]KAI1069074.1 hypothetical protein LB507_006355 [Fusarium sp. FIESC RH6]KAJ4005034.1 hypothetical protein NW752_011548 [Fusarium irregulare]KAJ4125302.1 hypothetical protein NW768_008918 [Fusarium equiseti]KAJ4019308.1 hypothetical protein NW766_003015 [Fusarium irregulare]RBR23923.1 hypothetical protein FIESC28_03233 [Fusarium coffeatum]
MHFASLLSIATLASAASIKVNFYSDTGCRNFIGSRFIDYNPNQGGTYHSGGPAGSRGGLYVDSNGSGLSYRGFSNRADGSQPFTGNLRDGQCIGTTAGLYAVFTV